MYLKHKVMNGVLIKRVIIDHTRGPCVVLVWIGSGHKALETVLVVTESLKVFVRFFNSGDCGDYTEVWLVYVLSDTS